MESSTERRTGIPAGAAVTLGVASAALLVTAAVLLYTTRNLHLPPDTTGWSANSISTIINALGVCALGTVIALKQPSNRIGWIFLAAGSGLAIGNFGSDFVIFSNIGHHAPVILGDALAAIGGLIWPIPVTMLMLLLQLFPTGNPTSRRWRTVALLTIWFGAFLLLLSAVLEYATWRHPFMNVEPKDMSGLDHLLINVLFPTYGIAFPALMILSLVCVVLRFRRARGDERLQMKWFTFAAVFVVVAFIASALTSNDSIVSIAQELTLTALWIAIGIAILKHRLYDIDVVIRKTVVGGILVVFVTAVYAIVVAGLGALGSSFLDQGPLIAAATAVIALAFQPVLRRARRLASRLVYGERATPYEVLSEFSERMGETFATDDVPGRMSRILGEGTGASVATVWLNISGQLRPAATWPSEASPPDPVSTPRNGDEPVIEGAERAFAVRHQGELLGALTVSMPPDEPLTAQQEKLCADLAAQAGLVLRNVRLIEDLKASRQRLVAAQDEERRKLERNLHDGAQQQLVALAVKEGLASNLIDRDPQKAKALLGEIQNETSEALETLRDLARGIYPPLLADGGLATALQAQARKAPLPVRIDADGIGRFAQDVEAAVYFSCLEALQNVSKYANASAAWVTLRAEQNAIAFTVRDDGAGFDTRSTNMGTGLQGISDRLAALGGRLDIESAPGAGTRLHGRVPDG